MRSSRIELEDATRDGAGFLAPSGELERFESQVARFGTKLPVCEVAAVVFGEKPKGGCGIPPIDGGPHVIQERKLGREPLVDARARCASRRRP